MKVDSLNLAEIGVPAYRPALSAGCLLKLKGVFSSSLRLHYLDKPRLGLELLSQSAIISPVNNFTSKM